MPTAGAARAYRAGTRAAAGAEALALRARGARVTTIAPDPPFDRLAAGPAQPRRRGAPRVSRRAARIAQLP